MPIASARRTVRAAVRWMGFEAIDINRALPFWGAVVAVMSCFTFGLAPIYNSDMYWDWFNMSHKQFNNVVLAATAGTYITILPGEVAKARGVRTLMIWGAAATVVFYGYGCLAYSVGWLVAAEGSQMVVLSFLIGSSAGAIKMASLLTTFNTMHPTALARGFGVCLAVFEGANFLYAMLTEVWTEDLFYLGIPTNQWENAFRRRIVVAIVALGMAPTLYTLPRGVAARVTAEEVNMRGILSVLLVSFCLATVNWTQNQGPWCHTATWTNADLMEVFSTCICPWSTSIMWGAAICTTAACTIVVVKRRGWSTMVSVPLLKEHVGAKAVNVVGDGAVVVDMEARSLLDPSAGSDGSKGAEGGAARLEGAGGRAAGADLEALAVASERGEGVTASSRRSMELALVAFVTLGVGTAVGNNYYFISASLHSEKLFGFTFFDSDDATIQFPASYMTYAWCFLGPKMLAAGITGCAWDAAAPGSQRRQDLVRNTPLLLGLGQFVMGIGPLLTSDNAVLYCGLMTAGWATGSMSVLVPILTLEWYGRDHWIRMFSVLMTVATLGMFTSYGLMQIDWEYSHAASANTTRGYDDEAWEQWSELSVDDVADNSGDGWGMCAHQASCFRAAFIIQAAMCAGATLVAHKMFRTAHEKSVFAYRGGGSGSY